VTNDDLVTYVERTLGRDVSPSEFSDYWFSEAFSFIKNNPRAAFALFLRKTALYFNGYEVPHMESYDLARARYGTLRLLFVSMWMLLSLGFFGMLYGLRQWRKHFLLYGYVLAFSFSIILFFVTSRYRIQIAPALALFAAYAVLVTLPTALMNLRRQLLPVVALAAIVLVTNPSLFALAEDEVLWVEYTHEARRLSKIGKHDEALAVINKGVALHPDYADSYINRALVQKAAGKSFEVVEDYARAVDLDPNQYAVQYDFGQVLRQLRMYEPAIEAYHKAIELNPVMLEAYNNLGITYRTLRRYDEAHLQFQKVIELDPHYIKAYNNLGASLAESGDLDRAIDVMVRGMQVDPDYANTYKNLGMAYIQKRDVRLAYEMFEKYLTLKPDDSGAQDILAQLQVVLDGDTLQGQ
jgi:tetratricopeptide (TPR) repeat protein